MGKICLIKLLYLLVEKQTNKINQTTYAYMNEVEKKAPPSYL